MGERDKGDGRFRAALIVSEAIHEVRDGFEVLSKVIGTDEEIVDKAIENLERRTGSPVLRLTPDQARMERNRFYFSSATWTAPWEPTGPDSPDKPRLN